MAAGRHGGYRDHEFRVRESDPEVSMKKDYYLERCRHVERDRRDPRGTARESHKDMKKREYLNGYHRSPLSNPSGGNDNGRSHSNGRLVEREPGELSSGSGSDGVEPPVSGMGRDNGTQRGKENGAVPSLSKKRKFSPIIWDREDVKKSSIITSGGSKGLPLPVVLPSPPPILNGCIPEKLVETVQESRQLGSPADVDVSIDSPQDQQFDNYRESSQLEEEFLTNRNISTSRWASGSNAFDDDGDAYDEEATLRRRKNIPLGSFMDQALHKVSSPYLGEFITREGSEGSISKSSGSGREHRGEQEVEVEGDDHMDIDMAETSRLSDTESESEDVHFGTPEPADLPRRSVNMLQGCRYVEEFERLNRIDEGTYGVVYRARDKRSGEIVALKRVKLEKEREGFPLTSLREINILLSFHHPSIVDVKEVVVSQRLENVFMVMEYMEHDLKALMETMRQPFSQSEVKCLMLQLLEGVKYLHDNWVLHRDLKTSNLLFNNRGELKICDFGLSRQYGSPLKPYTQLVVTLWYRAPELLLGAKEYSTAIDMWSLGCIMAELLGKEPLFCGKTELDQIDKIFKILGNPSPEIWPAITKLPGWKSNLLKQQYRFNRLREKFPVASFSGKPTLSEAGFDLLNKLLTYDPEKRITAEDALNHHWFREVPLPKSKDFMPTFPAQHAQDRRLRRVMKSPDPLEELRIKEAQQGNLGVFA